MTLHYVGSLYPSEHIVRYIILRFCQWILQRITHSTFNNYNYKELTNSTSTFLHYHQMLNSNDETQRGLVDAH